METTTTPAASRLTNAEAARIIIRLVALLATRATSSTLRALRAAATWLRTPHTYGEEDEAVTITGLQYVGISALTFALSLILCITL